MLQLSGSEAKSELAHVMMPLGLAPAVGAIELSLWDLMGIVIGLLTSGFLAFSFITRGARYERFSEDIGRATEMTIPGLEKRLELSSFVRLLSPRQSIKLESLLDERKDAMSASERMLGTGYDSGGMAMVATPLPPPSPSATGVVGEDGYEWLTREDGNSWYRRSGMPAEWELWNG